MDVLAEARQVTMRFGSLSAVDATDLAVTGGEVVGLLGANGAGKTTLIRLLLGLLEPTGGIVRLFGSAPSAATRRRVGYVPQTLGLYVDLTVAENWSFTAAAFGTAGAVLPQTVAAWRGELVGALPLGAQRQVAFAVALSRPAGAPGARRADVGRRPLGAARRGRRSGRPPTAGPAVLVTTHNMEEAQECDRLVVMADGRAVARGTTADIIGGRTVTEVRCDDDAGRRSPCSTPRGSRPSCTAWTGSGSPGRPRPSVTCSPARDSTRRLTWSGPTSRRRSWPLSRHDRAKGARAVWTEERGSLRSSDEGRRGSEVGREGRRGGGWGAGPRSEKETQREPDRPPPGGPGHPRGHPGRGPPPVRHPRL